MKAFQFFMLASLFFLTISLSGQIFASGGPKILCASDYMPQKAIIIQQDQLRSTSQGYQKTVTIPDFKGTLSINIRNLHAFDSVEDSVTLMDQSGHSLTYPLDCQNLGETASL